MKTNLRRRVNKLRLTKNNILITVIEAVVNAMQSITEAAVSDGRITVTLHRDDSQLLLEQDNDRRLPPVAEIEIEDNGAGFTEENMESFLTLDSARKEKLGGRGVGRLQWLKVFENVQVSSVYEGESTPMKREFSFNVADEVKKAGDPTSCKEARHTIVRLACPRRDFESRFRNCTAEKVADYIKENCIYDLLSGASKLTITVKDPYENKEFDVVELAKKWVSSRSDENFVVDGHEFKMTHVMLSDTKRQPVIVYYGNTRPVVNSELSALLPELNAAFKCKEQGYMCQVCSEYLDSRVSDTRDGFDIADSNTGRLPLELSFDKIQQTVVEHICIHMKDLIDEQKEKAYQHVRDYVDNRNPRYRSVLPEIVSRARFVATDNDKEIEKKLHDGYVQLDNEFFEKSQELLGQLTKDQQINDEFEEKIHRFAKLEAQLHISDLATYVWRRRSVLEILEKIIGKRGDKKYFDEKNIHQLIMPMKKESDVVAFERSNLWIIDERLAFHHYLASDLELREYGILETSLKSRPDIAAFFDNPMYVNNSNSSAGREISIVEFKKPMRSDTGRGKNDPTEQALYYLQKIRSGKLKTLSGRPIEPTENIPGYCYIICDITENMQAFLDVYEYSKASDQRYFHFNKSLNVLIEVIGYDTLVKMAKERNLAFFATLGISQS